MPFAPHRLPSPHRRPLLDTPHQSAGAIDVSPHLVVTVVHVKAHAQRVRIPPLGAMANGSPAAPVAGGGVATTGEIRSEIPATRGENAPHIFHSLRSRARTMWSSPAPSAFLAQVPVANTSSWMLSGSRKVIIPPSPNSLRTG